MNLLVHEHLVQLLLHLTSGHSFTSYLGSIANTKPSSPLMDAVRPLEYPSLPQSPENIMLESSSQIFSVGLNSATTLV